MADDPGPEAGLDDVVTVTEGDLTVEKRFSADEFPVPAVEFVIRSTADEPVDVRLTDSVPESFPMEGIGFHPDYDSDGWTAYRDHRVEYERTLEPGAEVTTVYGIRIDDPEEARPFLGRPRIERLSAGDGVESPEDVLGRDTTRSVRDALAGDETEAEAETGLPTDDVAAALDDNDDDPIAEIEEAEPDAGLEPFDEPDGSEPEPLDDLDEPDGSEPEPLDDLDEPDGSEPEPLDDLDEPGTPANGDAEPRRVDSDLRPAVTRASDGESDDAGGEAAGAAVPAATPGSVAAALAAEIRAGEVPEADVETLRDALAPAVPEPEPSVPRSVEVRIDRLQNRTEDLAAYTDALEEFIDEEGTGAAVIEGVRSDLDGVRADVSAVEERLAAVEETDERLADRLDDARADLDAAAERVSAVESDVSGLVERVETAEGDLDALRTTVEGLEASVADLEGETDASVESVEERVDDLRGDVRDLESELDELRAFRERMRDAFGP
jgi:polyhydroxyalkanoate synthesis regulator phasin